VETESAEDEDDDDEEDEEEGEEEEEEEEEEDSFDDVVEAVGEVPKGVAEVPDWPLGNGFADEGRAFPSLPATRVRELWAFAGLWRSTLRRIFVAPSWAATRPALLRAEAGCWGKALLDAALGSAALAARLAASGAPADMSCAAAVESPSTKQLAGVLLPTPAAAATPSEAGPSRGITAEVPRGIMDRCCAPNTPTAALAEGGVAHWTAAASAAPSQVSSAGSGNVDWVAAAVGTTGSGAGR
jgi:hypothetical protein